MPQKLLLYFVILTISGAFVYKRPNSYTGSMGIINFKTTSISFGNISAGKKVIKKFRFQNTGTDTLRITTVQASDGGTIAYWPQQPIPPGAKNAIKVEFGFTESRSGYQDKQFTVITNARNNPVVLHLRGNVKKRE